MRTKIKVKLSRMTDANINDCTGGNVATLANFVAWVLTEQSNKDVITMNKLTNLPGMMSLLDDNKRNARLVLGLEFNTSLTNGT